MDESCTIEIIKKSRQANDDRADTYFSEQVEIPFRNDVRAAVYCRRKGFA